jgi:hypothetical protein
MARYMALTKIEFPREDQSYVVLHEGDVSDEFRVEDIGPLLEAGAIAPVRAERKTVRELEAQRRGE